MILSFNPPPSATSVEATFAVVVWSLGMTEALFPAIGVVGSSTPPSATIVEAVATLTVVVLSLVMTEALFPAIGSFGRLMGRWPVSSWIVWAESIAWLGSCT